MFKYKTIQKRLVASFIDILVLAPFAFLDVLSSYKIFFISLQIGYFVFLQAKYGQTPGKRLMAIKVLDYHETELIGYKRAIYREFLWIGPSLLAVTFHVSWADWIFLSGILLEMLTMLTNERKRSFQDVLATSVVIDVEVLNPERQAHWMQKRYK